MAASLVLMTGGGYAALRAERYFYPNRYPIAQDGHAGFWPASENIEEIEEIEKIEEIEETKETELPMEQAIRTVAEGGTVITADTVYLVESVNLTDGSIAEEEIPVPVKYFGLNREELVEELAVYDRNPPLEELKKGYDSCELTAFSKDRVVVCKYYREEEPRAFYLMVADHFVMVYEEDRQTLYMNTDILLEHLDEKLQAEIIQGKYIESEEALYNFLESYSS